MDGLYVFNNPWAIQAMEKHTSYCAMMALGMPIPDTWMVPPKEYEPRADLDATLERYAQLFDLGAVGDQLGYPMFMKPYDGGGWAGVSRVDDEAGLRAAYEGSGTYVMHLQKAVDPFDLFVRCIGFGPQMRIIRYDPTAPLHDRYTADDGGISDDERSLLTRHHAAHQQLLRLGLQLVRGAAPRTASGTRSTSPTPAPTRRSRRCTTTSRGWWRPTCAGRSSAPRPSDRCAGRSTGSRTTRSLAQDLPYRERLAAYGAIAHQRFETDALRGVLRQPPRSPRRGGVGVLRHTGRQGRRAPEGGGAVPGARGRRVHRAVLEPDPDVARRHQRRTRDAEAAMKERTAWYSTRVERDVKLARWGSYGTPVLVFPTAGGDAEEIERFHLVDAVGELLDAGA